MQSFQIAKAFLQPLVVVLDSEPLEGKDSRIRTHFVKRLERAADALNFDRVALLDELADKNAKGEAINKDGQYLLQPEKRQEFDKKFEAMLQQPFTMTLDESILKTFERAKEIVLGTKMKFSAHGNISPEQYDEICKAFENLVEAVV